MAPSTVKVVLLAVSAVLPQALAGCWVKSDPSPFNDVCSALSGDANLQTNLILFEDKVGDCVARYAPIGGILYQKAAIVYTGRDSRVTSTTALNTVQDVAAITGTYTFNFDIPQTNLQPGSPVTQLYIYSAPSYPDFHTFSWNFAINEQPIVTTTKALTAVTATSTGATVTTTRISTKTKLSGRVTLTSYSTTRTVKLPAVTVNTTAPVYTAQKTSTIFTTTTTTAICLPNKSTVTKVLARRDATYAKLLCGQTLVTPVSTVTVTVPTNTVTKTFSVTVSTSTTKFTVKQPDPQGYSRTDTPLRNHYHKIDEEWGQQVMLANTNSLDYVMITLQPWLLNTSRKVHSRREGLRKLPKPTGWLGSAYSSYTTSILLWTSIRSVELGSIGSACSDVGVFESVRSTAGYGRVCSTLFRIFASTASETTAATATTITESAAAKTNSPNAAPKEIGLMVAAVAALWLILLPRSRQLVI
ncbi:hypothetical protein LZ30DRAFT_773297 [Colletotrichum cereale]|nr:hypothetical protein LZ30DRAFT_773297 [Colletotrichum cereale]